LGDVAVTILRDVRGREEWGETGYAEGEDGEARFDGVEDAKGD
jgi:hypothetical protein